MVVRLFAAFCSRVSSRDAQEAQPPVFRTGVRVVRVDVSVTGKGDRPVADLTAADFTLEEDGVKQAVDTAQFLQLDGHRDGDTDSLRIRSQEHAEAEAASATTSACSRCSSTTTTSTSARTSSCPLRKALLSFLDRLGPADLAASGWTRSRR